MHFYSDLQPLHALSFDLDDTLYDNRPVIARAELKLINFLQGYHPALHNLGQDFYKRFRYKLLHDEPEIYHDVSYWRWRSIKLAMCSVGLNKKEAHIGADIAMKVLLHWRNKIEVPLETHQTLEALSRRWPLIVITNGNASIKKCGLSNYFCHLLRAGKDGRAKPWHDMYHLATILLKLHPKNILHVGDDLKTDVIGAISYGMQACWINDRGDNCISSYKARLLPNIEINKLSSLISLL